MEPHESFTDLSDKKLFDQKDHENDSLQNYMRYNMHLDFSFEQGQHEVFLPIREDSSADHFVHEAAANF